MAVRTRRGCASSSKKNVTTVASLATSLKVCQNPTSKSQKPKGIPARGLHSVNKEESSPLEELTPEESNLFMIYSLSSRSDPIKLVMEVNGHKLDIELDTGASVSVISEDTFNSVLSSLVQLCPSNVSFTSYSGHSLEVLGTANVKVKYQTQTVTLPIVVFKGKGVSLFDRDWLKRIKLDWQSIKSLRINTLLDEVIGKHSRLFRSELGKLNGMKAKICVPSNAQPRYYKPHPVPYSLRDKVDQELESLLKAGIISPVQYSDWAAPIVPVVKSDGNIRICGDYKVTVNAASKLEENPIPQVEDLFATLSGEKLFSKLDLSHAYQQIVLKEDSKKLTTINTQKGLF